MAAGPSKEVYTFKADWPVYAMDWSAQSPFKAAVGSFVEEYANKVQVIEFDAEEDAFVKRGEFNHPYPATKVMFIPSDSYEKELVATTGDYLRIWNVGNCEDISLVRMYNSNRNSDFCAPLTSFDWNSADLNIVATASIDTTVTIWDIAKEKAVTQLIAHDKEVLDISFCSRMGPNVFASVGADASVRLFDRRNLEHSTIVYESPSATPLLRLSWNMLDPNYVATFSAESSTVEIIDVRVPSVAALKLNSHSRPVNTLTWAPHSSCHICTGADDMQAYIWDVQNLEDIDEMHSPILCYTAEGAINQMRWSTLQVDWMAINFDDKVQMLHV